MNIDPYKRELLYRKAQEKKLLGAFEKKISGLFLERHLQKLRLNLPETDRIINFIRSLHVTQCIEKTYTSLGDCFDFVSAEIEEREFYVLVDEDWKYCGAVSVGSGATLNCNFNFDNNTSDELRFIVADFSTQITVDYVQDSGECLYECSIKRYMRPNI